MSRPASSRTPHGLLDIFGCAASVACALHCVALPVLFATYPLLPLGGLRRPWVEWAFVLISLVVGVCTFGPTAESRHGRAPIALFLAGGATLIAVRTLVPEYAPNLERFGLLFGAVLLTSAHLVNRARASQRCACAACEASESRADVLV
jgi:hypothetical protein